MAPLCQACKRSTSHQISWQFPPQAQRSSMYCLYQAAIVWPSRGLCMQSHKNYNAAGIGLFNAIKFDASIFAAVSPHFAVRFFLRNGFNGWRMLGGILLCNTGSEALFADLGHFSVKAIQATFFHFIPFFQQARSQSFVTRTCTATTS